MAGLRQSLADVNWLADRSPGFLWRHQPDDGPLQFGELGGHDDAVVTLSVWMDFAALQQFVYRSAHGLFMRQRARWFEPIGGFSTAMWWSLAGVWPSVDEGLERLTRLRVLGPTPDAFSLRRQFDPPSGPPSAWTPG